MFNLRRYQPRNKDVAAPPAHTTANVQKINSIMEHHRYGCHFNRVDGKGQPGLLIGPVLSALTRALLFIFVALWNVLHVRPKAEGILSGRPSERMRSRSFDQTSPATVGIEVRKSKG
jgi:hypothetical protein